MRLTATELRRLLVEAPDDAADVFVRHVAARRPVRQLIDAMTPTERDALLHALFQMFSGAGGRIH